MREADVNRLRIALGRISRLVDRQIAGDGMTRTQLAVLGTVARRKTLGVSELAEIEGLNSSMVSRVLGKLETIGLVERGPDPRDRRVVIVQITAAGAKMHRQLRQQRTRLFAQRLTDLPAGEDTALLAALPALESLADALRPSALTTAGAGR